MNRNGKSWIVGLVAVLVMATVAQADSLRSRHSLLGGFIVIRPSYSSRYYRGYENSAMREHLERQDELALIREQNRHEEQEVPYWQVPKTINVEALKVQGENKALKAENERLRRVQLVSQISPAPAQSPAPQPQAPAPVQVQVAPNPTVQPAAQDPNQSKPSASAPGLQVISASIPASALYSLDLHCSSPQLPRQMVKSQPVVTSDSMTLSGLLVTVMIAVAIACAAILIFLKRTKPTQPRTPRIPPARPATPAPSAPAAP